MRLIRYKVKKEDPSYGWIQDDLVGKIEGDPFGSFHRIKAEIPLINVKLLPPVQPSKIICIGRNYTAHAKEHGVEVPKIPLIFLKPPSAIIGPGENIVLPPQSSKVEHEAELVVVIGKKCRNVTIKNANEFIYGYTVGNDVTARDIQFSDGQWTRGKGFDTFCPIGPWVDTDFDSSDALITCRVSGQPRQMASTRDMIFPVASLLAFVSSAMTLEPGDLIFTGTPAGVGLLKTGDEVTVEIEGLGVLKNPVVA